MILLTLIVLGLTLIVFLKAKKIKELNKNLIKKETTFVLLYEQRFDSFLKLLKNMEKNIQESIYMDIAELRKESIFIKNQENNRDYLKTEEKIQLILKKVNISKELNKIETPESIELNNHINSLNDIIEETKSEYNNLIDDFNQEKNDFFGKKISKSIKELKVFKHI